MLHYHTAFAKIISQCSQQYYIIFPNYWYFTIDWFEDYSASWVHRGNDQPTRITVVCRIFILLLKRQSSYFVLNSSFDIIIYPVKNSK